MMRKNILFVVAILSLVSLPLLGDAANFTVTRFRAQTVNGAAIPGAKLYFYASGTTTPKATYSDYALSVANANPVVADSAGWFSEIYMNGTAYKVVLKDSANATVWTSDNYYAAQNTVPGYASASSSTSLSAFTATNSSTGDAITATNNGSGDAIVAQGGSAKVALRATGGASADGVLSTGGSSSGAGGSFYGGSPNGNGLYAAGAGLGDGIYGQSGATGAYGLRAHGLGTTSAGVYGYAAVNGYGVMGQSVNGYGVVAYGDMTSPARSSLRIVPQDTAPTTADEGDVYANSTTKHLYYYNGSSWKQLDN